MTELTDREFNGTETEEIKKVAKECLDYLYSLTLDVKNSCDRAEDQCPKEKSICCSECDNITKCPDVCPELNVRNGAGRR